MNLTIDCGNSRTKLAIFNDGKLITNTVFDDLNVNRLQEFVGSKNEIENAIYAIDSGLDSEVEEFLNKNFKIIRFSAETPIPIANNYESTRTLGIDRLATAVGAKAGFPNNHLLIIDAGTAITYDFVDKNEGFMGGSISPGLKMRFKALNTFTQNLPLVEKQNKSELTGNTTESAIISGVQNGIVIEMDGVIDRYRSKYEDLQIIVTGGDLNFFNNKLKSHIFADSFLLLKGLNTVLEHNA